ncbi:MAG: primosomal protein DnaI [Hydrogenibacillus sp.]|nr:primosomal protein DnaI [Hydrogenibacillus sp.]
MFKPLRSALFELGLAADDPSRRETAKRLHADPRVQTLMRELEVDEAAIDRSRVAVLRYLEETAACERCPGLSACTHAFRGHVPVPRRAAGGHITFDYAPCAYERQAQAEARRKKLFKTIAIPVELSRVRFADLKRDAHNAKAIEAAQAFVERFIHGRNASVRGLYVYGPFGVGKSYLMGAVANHLVEFGVSVLYVHMPALFRELRMGFEDGLFLDKMRELESVDVLILDDVGAEQLTPWARDEVLLPLLSARSQNGRPTLFTSNLSPDDLTDLYSETARGGIDELKAHRIVERIRASSDVIFLGGPNRRRNAVR